MSVPPARGPIATSRKDIADVSAKPAEQNGATQYVMAGHPAPIVLPRTGPPAPLDGGGLPIGMIEHATYDDESVMLSPGDRLYFYTDGAIEALDADEQEFGSRRLIEAIDRVRGLPLRAGLDLVARVVLDWSGDRLGDDVSLLAIERAE